MIAGNNPRHTVPTLRELISDAIRYWEPRRIAYNLILATIFCICVATYWPRFVQVFSLDRVPALFILAVLANVMYCSAYALDLFVQMSGFRHYRRPIRHIVWLVGMLFASALTFYWSVDEILAVAPG